MTFLHTWKGSRFPLPFLKSEQKESSFCRALQMDSSRSKQGRPSPIGKKYSNALCKAISGERSCFAEKLEEQSRCISDGSAYRKFLPEAYWGRACRILT